MRRITSYVILSHDSTMDLEKHVQDYIIDGYEPFGNLLLGRVKEDMKEPESFLLHQPMVKYEDAE